MCLEFFCYQEFNYFILFYWFRHIQLQISLLCYFKFLKICFKLSWLIESSIQILRNSVAFIYMHSTCRQIYIVLNCLYCRILYAFFKPNQCFLSKEYSLSKFCFFLLSFSASLPSAGLYVEIEGEKYKRWKKIGHSMYRQLI